MKARDFLGNTWVFKCMGCAIAREELVLPGGFLRKSGLFCVHQDPLIPLEGFVVIASMRHIRSIGEMSEEEYTEFSSLVRETQVMIKRATHVESLTLIQEEHSSHFHLWFFPWLPDVILKYGQPSLVKVREIMAAYARAPISREDWMKLEKRIKGMRALITPRNS